MAYRPPTDAALRDLGGRRGHPPEQCTAGYDATATDTRAYVTFEHAQGKARGVKYRLNMAFMAVYPKESGSTRQNRVQARNSVGYSLIYPMFWQ